MKTLQGHHRTNTLSRAFTCRAACALLSLALFSVLPLRAATLSWSGGGGANANWNTSANWGFAGTPASGDTLVFPAGQPNPVNTNNIASLVLAQIRFAGAGGGYDIRGNAFTLTNGIVATNTAGANTIRNDITLSTVDQTVNVASGTSLTLAGLLGGSVGVTKTGLGTLTYDGPGDNAYSGTTRVNAGTLQLDVSGWSAFGGPLIIGDGSGTGSPTVRLTLFGEINESVPITINASGLLDLNNFDETISTSLTLNGGTVQSGTGTLTLSDNSTVTVGSGGGTISGKLNLGNGTCAVASSGGDLTVSAAVSGAAGLSKSGGQTLYLTSSNSYAGLTVVRQGHIWIQNSFALGGTGNGTVVSNSASLVMSGGIGVTNESLTLNGPGTSAAWGALDAEWAGTNIWAGPITVNADSTIVPYSASTHLRIIGPISGAGGVEKFANSSGTLYFEGGTVNTYAGLTRIIAGTNVLGKGAFDGAIPGDVQVGDATHAAKILYRDYNQIANDAIVTLYDGCVMDLNNYFDGIGGWTMYGAQVVMGTGFVDLYAPGNITANYSTNSPAEIYGRLGLWTATTLNVSASYFWPQLQIEANVYGPQGITKLGPAAAGLFASNSFSGLVTVNAGDLVLDNSYALGTTNNGAVVSNGASLYLWGNVHVPREALTLNGAGSGGTGGALYALGGSNSWAGDITFATESVINVWPSNTVVSLDGALGGPAGFTKIGPGTLIMAGSTPNTYAGETHLEEGVTLLNKTPGSAIPYPRLLVIGGTTNSAEARELQNYQTDYVRVDRSGLLNLNGYDDWVADLQLFNGGDVQTGAGSLGMPGGDVVTVADPLGAGSSSISGNVQLDSGAHRFDVTNGGTLLVFAAVAGDGHLTKAGGEHMHLMSSNAYHGLTVVQRGFLWAQNTWALGTTTNGTVVSNSASLVLQGSFGITNEALTLNGAGPSSVWGALDSETAGTNVWAGPITVNADSTIVPYGASTHLRIIGAISGAGGVEKFANSSGTLYFEGNTANTYAGTTRVNAGALVLNKTIYSAAVPNALIVGDGAGGADADVVRVMGNPQIDDYAAVTVNNSGLIDWSSDGGETIGSLAGNGHVELGAGGLTTGINGQSTVFSGLITGLGGSLYKSGPGTMTLTANNSYSGSTVVDGGTLLVNGSQPQSPVTVWPVGTLGGTGVVGPIYAQGNLRPGVSPGCLTSSNLTFTVDGDFYVELNGTTACSGYDQMIVRGTNNLANATLHVTTAFPPGVPAIGDQFILIANDAADAVTGTFNGLPNGAAFNVGGIGFRINYNGGTGNDVVLTVLNVPGSSLTVNAADRGWYNQTGFHDPGNDNYVAGEEIFGTTVFRNWFVFDVPLFSGDVVQAELLINCYTNASPQGQETYVLRHVATPIATLIAGGSGLTNIYNDLADGAVYSVRDVSVLEQAQRAIIPLNVTFITNATAASGGQIALGGAIATFDGTANNERLFGFSSYGFATDVQLRLTFGTATVINATKTGWYDDTGNHSAANLNYTAGESSGGARIYRDFFVFGLPVVSSQLLGAELLLNSYTDTSPTGVLDYQLRDVTTPITTLTNDATGATGIYADLANGGVYGGRNVYTSESGMRLSVPLNRAFLGAANANGGGQIALGGAVLGLNPIPDNDEYVFGWSLGNPGDVQLWLGSVPATLPLASFATGSPTPLGGNRFQLVLNGTTGTTNEIQASLDLENWDVERTLYMASPTMTFTYTNTWFPQRFFRARLLK